VKKFLKARAMDAPLLVSQENREVVLLSKAGVFHEVFRERFLGDDAS
jgi:hypothetical protein